MSGHFLANGEVSRLSGEFYDSVAYANAPAYVHNMDLWGAHPHFKGMFIN